MQFFEEEKAQAALLAPDISLYFIGSAYEQSVATIQ